LAGLSQGKTQFGAHGGDVAVENDDRWPEKRADGKMVIAGDLDANDERRRRACRSLSWSSCWRRRTIGRRGGRKQQERRTSAAGRRCSWDQRAAVGGERAARRRGARGGTSLLRYAPGRRTDVVASGALPGFNEERLCSEAQQGETETRGQQPGEQQPAEAQGRGDAVADTKA
jgi:hypothetical protein